MHEFLTFRKRSKLSYIIGVEFLQVLVSFGTSELSEIERCRYYRGRVCESFDGLSSTKCTVRNGELSIRRGLTVLIALIC